MTILMYHRILPLEQCIDYPLQALIIPDDVFRLQMKYLASSCRVLPVHEALDELKSGLKQEKPLVSVTFDDGYLDNYSLAAPILEDYGLRSTFFITSGFIDKGSPQWYDRAAVLREYITDERDISVWMEGLKNMPPAERRNMIEGLESSLENPPEYSDYRPMTIEQIRALHKRGHEIASHSVTHPILTQLKEAELIGELHGSAEKLGSWIGSGVWGFCYPNGNYNSRIEAALEQEGYHYACTVEEGINLPGCPPFRLSRLPITMKRTMSRSRHDPLGFRAELCRIRSILRGKRC